MRKNWLISAAAAGVALLFATAAAAQGFPSPNDPQNKPPPPPPSGNPSTTCDKNQMADSWIATDPRIKAVHDNLNTLLTEWANVGANFGAAPTCSSGPSPTCKPPKDDAFDRFSTAMGQFKGLAASYAVKTRPVCNDCQTVADYQLLKDLAKSNSDELVHSDKTRKIKLADINKDMVTIGRPNIGRLRGYILQAKTFLVTPPPLLGQQLSELDAIVAGFDSLLSKVSAANKAPSANPARNAALETMVAQYTCLNFDK